MQKHKKLSARILSLVLTAAMVGTMMPSTVLAAEGDAALGVSSIETTTRTITAFDELGEGYTKSVPFDGHTYAVTVKLGTPIEEIVLPTELGVAVEKTTTTTTPPAKDEVQDSGNAPEDTAPADEPTSSEPTAEQEDKPVAETPAADEPASTEPAAQVADTDTTVSDNKPASPSDAGPAPAPEEKPDADVPPVDEPEQDKPEQDKETTVTETTQVTIPVTWNGDKTYTPDKNSQVIYTAALPEGYTLANGVKLPQIHVAVGGQAQAVMAQQATLSQRTQPLLFDIDTPSEDMLSTEGWKWDKNTATLTLKDANFNVKDEPAIQIDIESSVNVVLEGTNTITGTDTAALSSYAPKLTIDMATGSNTTLSGTKHALAALELTLQGNGKLSLFKSSLLTPDAALMGQNVTIKGKSIVHAESTGNAEVMAFQVLGGLIIEDDAVFTAKVPAATKELCSLSSFTATGKTITCNKTGETNYTSPAFFSNTCFTEDKNGSIKAKDIKIATAAESTEVAFNTLTANGTANTTETTELTLTFDKDVANLAATDITVTGATKGTLTKESGTGVYKLTISNVTVNEGANVNVAVAKTDFNFTPANKDVAVHKAAAFVPVTDITSVPTTATAGTALSLSGTVAPATATNKTIVWSVKSAGTTGATISGSSLNTTAAGTVTVTATITNGLTTSSNFTKDFTITVNAAFVPVTDITSVPTTATAGTALSLSGTVAPTTATNQAIVWSVKSAGTTGATISGSSLNTTAAGTVTVTATITNGLTASSNFTKDFTITVNAAFVPVTDITSVPTTATAGTALSLSGTVAPATATNKTIVWSVKSAGTTGATISGSSLNTTAAGTVTVTATITNGLTTSSNFTKDFTITVNAAFVPVTDITSVPTTATAGTALALSGTVAPATATNKTIVWSVKTAGTTGATISGSSLNTTAAGTVTVTATITNGLTASSNFTKDFTITVNAAAVDKTAVSNAIAAANTLKGTVIVSDGTASSVQNGKKFVSTAAMETFTNAIAAAQAVANNPVSTADQVSAAVTALNNAVTAFNAAIKTGTYTSSGGGGGSSSGGGGSSSGGGSSTTPPTVVPPTTTQPNPPTTVETKVPATVDNKGNANVNVTDKTMQDAIDKAVSEAKKNGTSGNGVSVVISVSTGGKDANTVTVNLPKTVQDQVIAGKVLNTVVVVDRPDISINMNLATITEINKQAKSDVQLSATRMDNTKLSGDAKTAIGNRPTFDLKATYASGSKAISNFGNGNVTVGIPYTLQAGEVASGLYALYVDGNGKVTYLTNSSYDAEAKMLHFSTNHFSVYGIGYKAPTNFTDITNHWAKSDIEFVVNRGLFSGTSNTTFSPDGAMTRGMFVTALGRLAGIDVNAYKTNKFTDVKTDAYYAPYANWAASKGITNGTTATTFAPDAAISRQEMAVMMNNYAKALGYTIPQTRAANTFADNANIASWAADAVKQMQMAGILNGKNGNKFDPTGTATRGEISAMLRRYVELVIDRTTTEGWTTNDSGSGMYYQNGKALVGAQTISGVAYTFNTYGETTGKTATAGATTTNPALPVSGYTVYTVKKGDNLSKIAAANRCTVNEILALNSIQNPSLIFEGQQIKVPQR